MIVTTSLRGGQKLHKQAQEIAEELQLVYIKRRNNALEELLVQYQQQEVLLVTSTGIKYIHMENPELPFFFHPSSSMFRLKRLLKGEHDPFVEATQLKKGMTILDATLGLASDSIIAAFQVGDEGRVVGLEASSIISYVVQRGLRSYASSIPEMDQAMRRIEVVETNHVEYLQVCPSNSFDVVYFDPMFEETKESSTGIAPLKHVAKEYALTPLAVQEATRVARQRVVLKDSCYSSRFEELGFSPFRRKYASHWFGTIELG